MPASSRLGRRASHRTDLLCVRRHHAEKVSIECQCQTRGGVFYAIATLLTVMESRWGGSDTRCLAQTPGAGVAGPLDPADDDSGFILPCRMSSSELGFRAGGASVHWPSMVHLYLDEVGTRDLFCRAASRDRICLRDLGRPKPHIMILVGSR